MTCMHNDIDEQERADRRAIRRENMRRQKRRQQLLRRWALPGVGLTAVVVAGFVLLCVWIGKGDTQYKEEAATELPTEELMAETLEKETEEEIELVTSAEDLNPMIPVDDIEFCPGYEAVRTPDTATILQTEDMESEYAILVNANTGEIVGERNADVSMNPASMTKVLTVLVAAEQIENLDDETTISQEAVDYSYAHDCSNVGYEVGETVKVRDLFYGTILPSGAEAAYQLAMYTAGSQEAFVALMNEKLAELGMAESAHFTNCVGLYDENHYCTVYDMAMIMKAAMENDWCREVLTAHIYEIPASELHPDGIVLSNWFLRRIEDKDTQGEVLGAKTGYVDQSGFCCASCQKSNDGTPYICVTGKAHSSWRCIKDHVTIYTTYGNTSERSSEASE